VGPCQIAYGTVSAAGTIIRKDQIKPDHLIFGGPGAEGRVPWRPNHMGRSQRIIGHNIHYIANLFALRHWYDQVRRLFTGPRFPEALLKGLIQTLDQGLDERVYRLGLYIEGLNKTHVFEAWREIEAVWADRARERGRSARRDTFLQQLETIRVGAPSYLNTIQSLSPETARNGIQWLTSIVDEIVASAGRIQNIHQR
jgi:UDP-N-acetylglucosamine/UDP-N-acetylgalactosamine diphosphorylase